METHENDDRIRVLVVDDSALMRNLIGKIIEHQPDLHLVGKAMDGEFALQKIASLTPDVVVSDIEMPRMNGIEFLEERRRRGIDVPVIILSSLARRGARITMDALSLGASDFILKPTGPGGPDVSSVADELTAKVRAYGKTYRREGGRRTQAAPSRPTQDAPERGQPGETPERPQYGGQSRLQTDARYQGLQPPQTASAGSAPVAAAVPIRAGEVALVAIGISTGGPNALRQVFAHIPADIGVPFLVVQHMPPGFTEEFAASLDRICSLEVREARSGDVLQPGRVLIAPGDYHISVEGRRLATVIQATSDPPENGHRPSAAVLFRTAAATFGHRVLGVIMTGMGRDGAEALGDIYRAGGRTLGQDGATSVVYGMPRVAHELGFVRRQVPLEEMAGAIAEEVRASRG